MEYIIETKELVKQFPGKLAVDHINMHVKKGDIYGFIGKNGAGKTTTMKLILGLLKPTEGSIFLYGSDKLDQHRIKIGSLIEAPGLYKNCTAFEIMKRFSILYGGTDQEIKELLELVGLGNVKKRKAGAFSLGMKQRLGIAIALLGNPEILILDEPINGLDPAGIKDIRDIIIKLNKERGVTFLISSHILDELSKVATRYGIVHDGVLVEEIDADVLMEKCRSNLKIGVDDVNKTIEILKKAGLLDKYDSNESEITMFNNFDDAAKINELLVKGGVKVSSLAPSNAGFEEYFIERIGR